MRHPCPNVLRRTSGEDAQYSTCTSFESNGLYQMPSAHAHIPPLSELVADAKHSRGLQGR
jgi:hypothetical protein